MTVTRTIYITDIIPEKSTKDIIAVNTLRWGIVRLIPNPNGYIIKFHDVVNSEFILRYLPIEGKEYLDLMERDMMASQLELPKKG